MSSTDSASATTRRDFLQGSLGVAGTMLAPSLSSFAVGNPSAKRPNLVFFFNEGHRADALSIAGHPLLKTPNHDRIAREGVRFTNAFCTNALCAPARATALTGLYSRTSGATTNQLKTPNVPLPADIPIFTDLLHQAGYEVAMVGKAHVGNGVRERYWDYYFAFNAPMTNYYNGRFFEGRKGVMGEEKIYKGQYADDLATDRALAWLSEEREKPFCLLLWMQAPHAPFFRARRHLDLYRNAVIPKPSTFDDDLKGYPGKPRCFAEADNKIGTTVTGDGCRTLEEVAKDYYAGLVDVDENIGRVFHHLEKSGELDDTAMLLSSDHGYFLGEWRMFDKRLMHEPSIRVPMMMRYPKRIPAGIVRKEQVLDIDIAPTLLELAGVKIPEHMQGKSMTALVEKNESPSWRKDWLYEYFEYPGYEEIRPHRGIRTERYKFIHYYLEPQEYEMYDLAQDPHEIHNLYGNPAHAALQTELTKRLKVLRSQIPDKSAA